MDIKLSCQGFSFCRVNLFLSNNVDPEKYSTLVYFDISFPEL